MVRMIERFEVNVCNWLVYAYARKLAAVGALVHETAAAAQLQHADVHNTRLSPTNQRYRARGMSQPMYHSPHAARDVVRSHRQLLHTARGSLDFRAGAWADVRPFTCTPRCVAVRKLGRSRRGERRVWVPGPVLTTGGAVELRRAARVRGRCGVGHHHDHGWPARHGVHVRVRVHHGTRRRRRHGTVGRGQRDHGPACVRHERCRRCQALAHSLCMRVLCPHHTRVPCSRGGLLVLLMLLLLHLHHHGRRHHRLRRVCCPVRG